MHKYLWITSNGFRFFSKIYLIIPFLMKDWKWGLSIIFVTSTPPSLLIYCLLFFKKIMFLLFNLLLFCLVFTVKFLGLLEKHMSNNFHLLTLPYSCHPPSFAVLGQMGVLFLYTVLHPEDIIRHDWHLLFIFWDLWWP